MQKKVVEGLKNMIKKTSADLCSDYTSIPSLTNESVEPERQEQIYKLKSKIAEAEFSRLKGEETVSVSEARERLRNKYN